uniref:Uncharacterized protein n=2 Tax=Anguilla anguilla TaxID=7936 RepID=A0A0E9RBU3_ANGAN
MGKSDEFPGRGTAVMHALRRTHMQVIMTTWPHRSVLHLLLISQS